MNDKNRKIFVAGHRGMVGSALLRKLLAENFSNVITRSSSALDLRDQAAVRAFFELEGPSHVYLAAAKVGGIHANNKFPAEFIYDNLIIEANVIDAAYQSGVDRLLFLGSSCIYPKLSVQPMEEHFLLSGHLESTNEPYAVAKIAGIKLCESYNRQYQTDFRSVMPTNLYGPGDNYHPENNHVIPALIRRFHEARCAGDNAVKVWGSGFQRREFLHVDDLASACMQVMMVEKNVFDSLVSPMCSHVNVGSGVEMTIKDLASVIAEVVGFEGAILFDDSFPDGPERKLLDSRKIGAMCGWRPSVSLIDGIGRTYADFLDTAN